MRRTIIYETETYSQNGSVNSDCADITFYNGGSDDVKINGLTLPPLASMTDPAFGDELNRTQYTVVFLTSVSPLLVVKRKRYL